MELSKTLFWDTDINKLDYEKHSRLIIERVLMRGTLNDWFEIKKYYGLERIKNETLKIRYLDKVTLNFCSKYFKIPKQQFRCYNTEPSIQKLWNY
ncbi:MAG: DUF6922 domain-containing protein [Salinivirgaceae bacterium]|jgi:hypothetical protein|nr:hypothetical protein [Bacteroidales bacterium]